MPRTIVSCSPISEGVNRRFFQALEYLVSREVIPSYDAFYNMHELSAPRYREMRKTYGVTPNREAAPSRYKNIEVEALFYLTARYSISARWLITGAGKMTTK